MLRSLGILLIFGVLCHGDDVLRCVVCNETEPSCTENAEEAKVVDCQMEDPDGPNYGNSCLVGHNVGSDTEIKYRRTCHYNSVINLGCHQKDEYLNGKPMVVDECICDSSECNRKMGAIETSSKSPETTTKENGVLECYYCASDDHNYGDCDAEHGGNVVQCQTENKDGEHYGHTCAVGHTVDMEEDIWRRDCFSPDDGFVGCKQDSRDNGTHSWNIEICVCEGSLCNIKMGDISSSSTSKSTTHKESGLECYYCQENGGEEHDVCTADETGAPVECQTNDPEAKHYGDVCAVGHVVSNESIPGGMTWRRDCAMKGEDELDCKDRIFQGREVYECLCDTALCNKNTDEETSTKKSTTVHVSGIECYYCGHEEEGCDADVPGEKVQCQMEDPEGHNYGNVCYVGHSVHEDEKEDHWWRGCKSDPDKTIGCTQHPFTHEGHEFVVDECVCDTPDCNEKMGDVTTSSTAKTTTPEGPGIECYYCGHEEEDCNADMAGEKVKCQMDDPEGHHYGNVCYVGHSVHEDEEEDHWWRGCESDKDKMIGCTQHPFSHDGHEIIVDECVCDTPDCNEKMGDVSTSSTSKTTTPEGNGLECYFCLSDDHNLGDCNAEHAGDIVTCSDNPEAKHYGNKCAVGHTVTEDDAIWRRDCVKEEFTGCKKDSRDNGTHVWDIELCVCEKKLCNEKMGDMPTSSTAKTTTHQVTDLSCYYCNSNDPEHGDCSADVTGEPVKCQFDDSKALHYGDACIIGHTVDQDKAYWGRDCVDSQDIEMGCSQRVYQNTTIEVCVCKESECNKDMKEESTTTNKAPTTTHKDPSQLKCYYCYGHAGTEHDNCDVDVYGDEVVCQMHDPRQPNYGDVCFIGHTETSPEAGSMTWRRGCEVRGPKHDGCQEYKWDGGNITVVECVCSDELCNKNVPDIPTTTPGNGLKCYACHDEHEHPDEGCTMNLTGPQVTCQTDNPEMPNYGDSCYVGHSVHQNISDEHWWRGCKSSQGQPMGCTQHQMTHHDHNVTVDECVCFGDLCNKNMTYDPTSPPNPHNGAFKPESNYGVWLLLTILALLIGDNQ